MGGSGDGYFSGNIDSTLRDLRRDDASVDRSDYEAGANTYLNDLLSDFNDRDVDAVNQHIDTIGAALERDVEGTIALRFGGSVTKHTYVDGLSDIDALVFLGDQELAGAGPAAVRAYLADRLRTRFPNTEITVGRLAVTVQFADAEIQLLPALKGEGDRVRISSADGESWTEIDPKGFASKLSAVNQENGGKVVPVVKLAKALISSLPDQQRVTGYHAEALAVEVFDGYAGERSSKAMLQHFFKSGAERVGEPIRDSTGQSVHVDDHLGEAGSLDRQIVASAFSRLARRMQLADSGQRVEDWQAIFGEL